MLAMIATLIVLLLLNITTRTDRKRSGTVTLHEHYLSSTSHGERHTNKASIASADFRSLYFFVYEYIFFYN